MISTFPEGWMADQRAFYCCFIFFSSGFLLGKGAEEPRQTERSLKPSPACLLLDELEVPQQRGWSWGDRWELPRALPPSWPRDQMGTLGADAEPNASQETLECGIAMEVGCRVGHPEHWTEAQTAPHPPVKHHYLLCTPAEETARALD